MNVKKIITLKTIAMSTLILSTSATLAQKENAFDCSVIYDEYDSLMHNKYLSDIKSYVPVIEEKFTPEDFIVQQQDRLKLHPDHQPMAIAVFKTNQNMFGKMLFRFTEHNIPKQAMSLETDENGEDITVQPTLTIDDIIVYQQIEEGYAPVHFGPVIIKTNHRFDIDGFGYFPIVDKGPEGEEYNRKKVTEKRLLRGDFEFKVDEELGSVVLEAVNDAELFFPTQSLCSEING